MPKWEKLYTPKWMWIAAMAFMAVALFAAWGLASGQEDVARKYFEKSNFTADLGGPTYWAVSREVNGNVVTEVLVNKDPARFGNFAKEGRTRPAKRVEVRGVEEALRKAGVEGRVLGTYRFNATHVVTLVNRGQEIWAVVWNNETVDKFALKFEKYVDRSGRRVLRQEENQSFVLEWHVEGYVAADPPLPFDVYQFYDESAGSWVLPDGTYTVVARGYFVIVYGTAVFATDRSYYITSPTLKPCFFRSWVDGSGSYVVTVYAQGRAMMITCPVVAPVFEIYAYVGWDAWLNRDAIAIGNKWFTTGCNC